MGKMSDTQTRHAFLLTDIAESILIWIYRRHRWLTPFIPLFNDLQKLQAWWSSH